MLSPIHQGSASPRPARRRHDLALAFDLLSPEATRERERKAAEGGNAKSVGKGEGHSSPSPLSRGVNSPYCPGPTVSNAYAKPQACQTHEHAARAILPLFA
jgi:hypothetical protein